MTNLIKKIKEKAGLFKISSKNIKIETYTRTGTTLDKRMLLAVVSILISILIWTFIALNGDSEGTKNIAVNIKFENIPKGHIAYTPIKNVDLKVSGNVSTLSRFEGSSIKAVVDLENMSTGTYNLPIKIDLPASIRLRSWSKTTVPVELSRYIERKIPLTWRLEGEIPEGKVISSVNLEPKEITVGGAEVDVLAIQSVNAILPKLKAQSNTLKTELEIVGIENKRNLERITLSSEHVNAKVLLEDEIQADKIPVKVSITGKPAEGLEISSVKIIPEMVSIHGKKSVIKKMKELVLSPIDITGLEQNIQLMVPIRPTDLDPDIELSGPDRARVEVTIRNKITTTTFSNINVALVGGNLTQFKIDPQAVSVTINASQSVMDTISSSTVPFSLYIDVSNIVSKQLSLPVLVKNLKEGVQIKAIDPEEVVVTKLKR